jgi:Flp pilus assembly protein TadD
MSTADLSRADNLIDLGRNAEAEALLRTFLVGDPENARALRLLTQSLLGTSQTEQCRAAARSAVAADPESEHAHRLLAIASSEAGLARDAERAAREATRLAPNTWQTHYTLGSILQKSGWTSKGAALESALRARELAPNFSGTSNLVGMCYAAMGQPDAAAAAYTEAIRIDPNDAMAMNNLAAIQLRRGRLSSASQLLSSGLSASPQKSVLHRNYDLVLLNLMRRLYMALYLVFLVQLVMAGDAGGSSRPSPYPARLGVGLALVALCGLAAWRVTRNLPRGAHLWARGLFGRVERPHRILIIRFALVLVVDLLLAVTPASAAGAVGTTGFLLFLGLLIVGKASATGSTPPNLRR